MMAKFPLLTSEECDQIVEALNGDNGSKWIDGMSPSDSYKEKIKRNLEQPMELNEVSTSAGQYIVDKLMACEFFTRRTLPKHLGRPRFNLYQDGGEYRNHADAAFMGNNPEIRTDLSMTLWLTEDYEGGELVLDYTSGAVMSLRETKGMMVFYPSGVMHRVNPVTYGQRICFIAWIESHIQDHQKRDILVDITNLVDDVEKTDLRLSDFHMRLSGIKHNLFRQWMYKA